MQDALQVFEQIRRATRTLRRLPPVTVQSRFCNWPEIIRSFYEIWRDGVTTPPRIGTTAKQITEMDQVIRWLAWMTQHPGFGREYTQILWLRANRATWRQIGCEVGKAPNTCRERFRIAVFGIFHGLDQGLIK